jgi:thiamine-phosphate pyrophosphorylase
MGTIKTKQTFITTLRQTGLYVITDSQMAGKPHDMLVMECAAAGARIIQVRDKELHDGALLNQALLCVSRNTGHYYLIINDRADIALLSGADGIHLGQEDLAVSEARTLLGNKAIIGLSTHNETQFRNALTQNIDYIALGPVFSTKTKISSNQPLGLAYVGRMRRLTDMPLVAIGGINLKRARELWKLGIDAVAIVSDIMKSDAPGKKIKEYLQAHSRLT